MKRKASKIDLQVKALCLALQERRLEVGMTQEELAERVGLHRTYISLIERTMGNFTMRIFMHLAYELGTTPQVLMKRGQEIMGKPTTKEKDNLVNAKDIHPELLKRLK